MDTRILIGVPTCEYARRADFYDHLDALDKPVGTYISRSHGPSPARNRNLIIAEAIKLDCTHVFFVDDDMAFKPDTLMRLLAHDKDIVTGLYLMRPNPHQPIIFQSVDATGRCSHRYLDETDSGLIEIVNCGLGVCLINTRVFKAMSNPWVTLGQIEQDNWCDDIHFFNKAREAGFKIYCDVDTPAGHSCTIWPHRVDNQWVTVIDTGGKNVTTVPQIRSAVLV
jgi:hypothetical protein